MIPNILLNIIAPIFILIGIGVMMERIFGLDLATLSKLNFYVFVPALVFTKTFSTQIDPALVQSAVLFNVGHFIVLTAFSWLLFSQPRFVDRRNLLVPASLFSNAGNYGLPLADLAFGAAGVSVFVIVILVQAVFVFTFGLLLISGQQQGGLKALGGLLRTPVIWALALAFAISQLGITVPAPISVPLNLLSDGLIPVALVMLGAQLARVRLRSHFFDQGAVAFLRLFVSPLLAVLMLAGWQRMTGVNLDSIAAPLVVAVGLPMAVNVYILAVEFDAEPELASQLVFGTTLLSIVTVTAWLAFV